MAAGVTIGGIAGSNQPAVLPHDGSTPVVDANLLSRLPYYLTKLACSHFPQWTIWNKLYGILDWKSNSGNIMRGVRHEPTPISETIVAPKAVYNPYPNKNVYNMGEMSEEAAICLQDFESKIFYFQPVWTDFLPALEDTYGDINRQIGVYSDNYARSHALARARACFLPGNQGLVTTYSTSLPVYADSITAPVLTYDAAKKSQTISTDTNIPMATKVFLDEVTDALDAEITAGTAPLGLTLATLDTAVAVMRDDIGVPFFEGAVNVPKNNECIAGKYVLICSSEVYQMLKWDPHYSSFRDWNFDALTNGFRGSIFNELTAHIERFPIRIYKDATDTYMPVPQAYVAEPGGTPTALEADGTRTDLGYPTSRVTTRVASDYKNAQYEVAWLLGADFFKTLRVGPPPSAFSGKMSKKKFYSMSWNGEVELTDQILIDRGSGVMDLNTYGRYCKYIASLALGAMPNNPYSGMPIIFARRRPPAASPAVTAVSQQVGSDPSMSGFPAIT